jgi:hypothetical protein
METETETCPPGLNLWPEGRLVVGNLRLGVLEVRERRGSRLHVARTYGSR